MRSMYEQSFNYLATSIVDYFNRNIPIPGDRFHIQLEKENDVESLCGALVEKASEEFSYRGYCSAELVFQGTRIIIASSHNSTENFLTNLRNRTADQTDVFEGRALLIIHHTDLDSIIGGSESLSKESRPLHAASLRKRLKEDIDQSPLQDYEKLTLSGILEEMRESSYEDLSSVFSYTPFMNILARGKISLEDWGDLGLFHDPELSSYNAPKEIKKRIEDNAKWFEKIQTSNRYSMNVADDLAQHFTNAGVLTLGGDNWKEASYGKVLKWHEEKTSKSLPEYTGIEESLFDGKYVYWERKEGETKAKSRHRHIIVFNPEKDESIELTLNFGSLVKQSAINLGKRANVVVEAAGKQIIIRANNCSSTSVIDRFSYEEPEASGKHIFSIAILPMAPDIFTAHKANYKVDGRPNSRCLKLFYEELLVFNSNETHQENRIELNQDDKVLLNPAEKTVLTVSDSVDDRFSFQLEFKGCLVPCEIYRDSIKPTRVTGVRIWKWKREQKKSFEYERENKLIFGNEEYFTHRSRTQYFLDLENEIINEHSNDCFWIYNKSGLTPKHLELEPSLREAFRKLTDYYRKHSLLPSLAYITPELKELMEQYIAQYIQELTSITSEIHLSQKKHNLLRIGTIDHADGERQIYFTPLHPLNVAYQLEIFRQTGTEKISEEILKCLSPARLLPYINDPQDSMRKLQPVPETELAEWIVYKPCNTLSRGWHNEYVQKLIAEKISEYTRHFPYLFTGSTKAPIRINLMHMGDCIDALKGIVRHFQRVIDTHDGNTLLINPIRLCIYGDHGYSNKFEEFARYSDPQSILRDFEIDLEIPKKYDARDVLKILQEKLHFYLKPQEETPDYAHITFFRFDQNSIEWTYQKMKTVKTGASLGGVVNAVPSVFRGEEYLTGFGSCYLPEESSELLRLAQSLNALARVAWTHDPFSKSEATFSALRDEQKLQLDRIYDSSNWVTLIDPKVDLNFFRMHETAKDLVIIHYSDQYNNSSGYDAITVTRKSKQYQAILNEFLTNRGLTPSLEDELKLINMFNAINGDWLLQLIAGRGQFPREKISILSAVKTMLAFLSHPNIVWVPLSLEEILRVSGGIGLKQSEGLFSIKNLGGKGSYCDDLLMAGVERCGDETIVHLYPVEVKIGTNNSSIIEKAKNQALHTANTLKTFLGSDKTTFTSAFYRNFFAKLILTGAEKMDLYGILPKVDWTLILEKSRSDLLNDTYKISWDLESHIGKATVLSFQKDCSNRSAKLEGEVVLFTLPESDGYRNLLEDVSTLSERYKDPNSSIDKNLFFYNHIEKGQKKTTAEVQTNNQEDEGKPKQGRTFACYHHPFEFKGDRNFVWS